MYIFFVFCSFFIMLFIVVLVYYIMYLNKNYDFEFVVLFILSLEIYDCILYFIKFMCFVFEIILKGFLK